MANVMRDPRNYPVSQDFPKDLDVIGEPSEEEAAMAKQKESAARSERLQAFGYGLGRKRDEWINARRAAGVDRRWRDDQDQYNAIDAVNRASAEMMASVEQGYPVTSKGAQPHRSTVFIGLTRQKTNSAEARLSDIVLPTDDRNFAIRPTPNPTLARQLADETEVPDVMGNVPQEPVVDQKTGKPAMDAQGQPITQALRKKDLARRIQEAANLAAQAMEDEIDDQLTECDYHGEVRKMLHDAAVLGTGVMKGPIATSKTRKAWVQQDVLNEQTGRTEKMYALQIVEETRPTSKYVPSWNVWPDPACGDNVQQGSGVIELELVTRKAVQEFAKQPYYLKDQLRVVLEQGPQKTTAYNDFNDPRTKDLLRDTLFYVWHYTGELNIEDMRAAGVEGLPETDDPLMCLSGCVVMINNTVVKAYLNPLETGDLPYDFFSWEKVSESVWGYGIPYLMRSQQRVLNAAWRQMMDNAGATAGPQVIIKKGSVYPADGQWTITSRKIWYANQDIEDVEKAFMSVDLANNQEQYEAIIKLAEDLVDKETGQPLITQGEQGSAPETVGGMQMLMAGANVVLRRLVKQFDDYSTKPHIRRYYDFNMSYSDKEEIKGDFVGDALGSSALLVRDMQNQAYLQLMQLAGNPIFGPIMKPRELFIEALKAHKIAPEKIVKSEDQIKQEAEIAAKNPPPNPQLMMAEARVKESTLKEQVFASEIEMRKEEAAQNFAAQIEKLRLDKEIAMLTLAAKQNISLEQIRADLAKVAINDRTKKELQAAEIALKQDAANTTHEGI